MDAKFDSEWGGWGSIDTSRSHGVGLWKYIRKGWRLFSSHIKFDPRDGSNIRFWDDVRCGGLSLKVAFPGLYNMASVKDVSIAANMDYLSGSLQCNVSVIRLIHDWEVDVLASFYTLLYSYRMRQGREDEIWWVPSCKGKFNVSSFYKTLTYNENFLFSWKSIWWTKALSRVVFFV